MVLETGYTLLQYGIMFDDHMVCCGLPGGGWGGRQRGSWNDGGSWSTVATIDTEGWSSYTIPLPSGAAGKTNLQIRFITNSKGKFERADIDEFRVFGF